MIKTGLSDQAYMKKALEQAAQAARNGEVPVGAILVSNGHVISKTHNQVELLQDPTAHAEILAITSGADYFGNKVLTDCELFVTLEPCVMCAGAIAHARIKRLVFAAYDPQKGFSKLEQAILHPKTEYIGGILATEAKQLLDDFFEQKRRIKGN